MSGAAGVDLGVALSRRLTRRPKMAPGAEPAQRKGALVMRHPPRTLRCADSDDVIYEDDGDGTQPPVRGPPVGRGADCAPPVPRVQPSRTGPRPPSRNSATRDSSAQGQTGYAASAQVSASHAFHVGVSAVRVVTEIVTEVLDALRIADKAADKDNKAISISAMVCVVVMFWMVLQAAPGLSAAIHSPCPISGQTLRPPPTPLHPARWHPRGLPAASAGPGACEARGPGSSATRSGRSTPRRQSSSTRDVQNFGEGRAELPCPLCLMPYRPPAETQVPCRRA